MKQTKPTMDGPWLELELCQYSVSKLYNPTVHLDCRRLYVRVTLLDLFYNPKTGKNIAAKYQTIRQGGGRVGVDPAPTGNWGEEAGQGSGGSQLQNWFSPNGQILILINVFSASSESQGLEA